MACIPVTYSRSLKPIDVDKYYTEVFVYRILTSVYYNLVPVVGDPVLAVPVLVPFSFS